MVTFKEEYVFKDHPSIVAYRDGIPVTQMILCDISLKEEKKADESKFILHFKSFYENFMNEFLEVCSEETKDKMEALFTKVDSKTQTGLITLFQTANVDLDKIFRRAYYELRKEEFYKRKTQHHDNLNEGIDELRDGFLDTISLGTASSAAGFTGLFFSTKYRYLSDKEVKREIKNSIIVWTICLAAGVILTWLLIKII